ncbi:hypothetical protein [Clostridium sp.]|uniref:hypothetical protein n=1 Tax=Clostridium sp. TaxID=1506 RepID=UPI00262E4FCF|nr:hypothetical protein [Clostridium sp.]
MFKLTWLELIFRVIPETLILMWGIHVFARKNINMFKYVLSSLILAISCFIIRYMPIYFGVHTDICLMITIILIMFLTDIPLIKNIQGTFLLYFMLTLGENINMILLSNLNINTDISVLQPILRCIYGIPSLIFLVLSIISIKYILSKKDGIRNVFN